MYLLTSVIVLMMMLAMATYGAFSDAKNSRLVDSFFLDEIQRGEAALWKRAEDAYKSQGGPGETRAQRRTRGLGKLSLFPLLGDVGRPVGQETLLLLERLIAALYGSQPFFVEKKGSPQFLHQFLIALAEKMRQTADAKNGMKIHQLANLDLGSEENNLFAYHLFHGKEAAVGSDLIALSQQEEGYRSLFRYTSMDKEGTIRLYLSPKPLLKAIFIHDRIVDDVLHYRQSLYQMVMKNQGMSPAQASKEFERFCQQWLGEHVIRFDMTVSKNNPRKYLE